MQSESREAGTRVDFVARRRQPCHAALKDNGPPGQIGGRLEEVGVDR